MSSIEEIMRARSAQNEALAEIDERIRGCKESINNYESLAERITTLPDKMSHEVMVPFGKLAFMPGKLVHTNELLVHLGGTWFSTMTCKQALKTIELRKKTLRGSLADFEKVFKNIVKKNEFFSEMEDTARSKQGEVEIKEDCPSNYTPKNQQRIGRKSEGPTKHVSTTDTKEKSKSNVLETEDERHSKLMQKLDELEKLEEEEDELCRLSTNDESIADSDDSSESDEHLLKDTKIKKPSRHVQWKDENQDMKTVSNVPEVCTIRFRHSKATSKPNHHDITPGDVYQLEQKKQTPKSILKSSSDVSLTPKSILSDVPLVEEEEHVQFKSDSAKTQAVSDVVVERSVINEQPTESIDTTTTKKPVSRFKAARRKLQQ